MYTVRKKWILVVQDGIGFLTVKWHSHTSKFALSLVIINIMLDGSSWTWHQVRYKSVFRISGGVSVYRVLQKWLIGSDKNSYIDIFAHFSWRTKDWRRRRTRTTRAIWVDRRLNKPHPLEVMWPRNSHIWSWHGNNLIKSYKICVNVEYQREWIQLLDCEDF